MKHIIFLVGCLSFIIAEINFSGDARIRPRLDIKDYGSDKSHMDLYYLYRARLNVDASIGEGWFFKAKIGTNSIAGMVKMSDPTVSEFNDGVGNTNSFRPQLSFLNLFYGIKKENFGFWGGALPLKYNPSLDIHFYPDKIVDIPWVTSNNASTVGFAGYIYKMNWFVSIDENKAETNKDTVEGIDEKNMDSFTLGLDFPLKWNDMLDLQPRALISFANADEPWPMTFGVDFNISSFFGINPQASYHMTKQFLNEDYKYTITHIRIKLDRKFGSGKFTVWADLAAHLDQMNNHVTDYTFLWLDYKCQLFESDFGSVSLKPTIRLLNKKDDESEYTRMKFELTTEIKFK
jgi:hypothetical protein